MSDPRLPVVPKAIKYKTYKPSGKWSKGSIVQMTLVILPLSLLIGVAAQYGGMWLPSLLLSGPIVWDSISVFLAGNFPLCGLMVFLPVVVVVLGVIGIVLFLGFLWYPVAAGYAIGRFATKLTMVLKCRSPFVAALMGFLGAATAYTSFALIRSHSVGFPDTSFSIVLASDITGNPWWLYVLAGVDALLVFSPAILVPLRFVRRTPFCEASGQWYKLWICGKLSVKVAGSLLEGLSAGTLCETAPLKKAAQAPDISIELYKCPSCDTSDIEVRALFEWIKKDARTKKETIVHEEWLRTMVSPQLGAELSQTISRSSEDPRSNQ